MPRPWLPSPCCETWGKCPELWEPQEVCGGTVETGFEMRKWTRLFFRQVSYKLSLLLFFLLQVEIGEGQKWREGLRS